MHRVVVILVLVSAAHCETNAERRGGGETVKQREMTLYKNMETSVLEGFQHLETGFQRWTERQGNREPPDELGNDHDPLHVGDTASDSEEGRVGRGDALDKSASTDVPDLKMSPRPAHSEQGYPSFLRRSKQFFRPVPVTESLLGLRTLTTRRRRAVAYEARSGIGSGDLPSGPDAAFFGTSTIFVHRLWPVLQDLLIENSITSNCVSSLLMTYAGIRNDDLWALKFLDSSGKVPSAFLEGTMSSLGSYDECLSLRLPIAMRDGSTFTGRYCMLHWNSSRTLVNRDTSRSLDDERSGKFHLGMCIPSKCTGNHLQAILLRLTDRHASVSVSSCRARNETSVGQVQVAIISLLIMWCTVVFLSTLIHLYWMRKESLPKRGEDSVAAKLIVALSAMTSTRTLLKPEAAESPTRILHGLKVVSLLWILLGQTYELQFFQVLGRPTAYFSWKDSVLYSVVVNWTLSFTTLLFVGGVTASTALLEKLGGHVGTLRLVALVLLRRYIALTLPAIFIVAVFMLYPLMLEGPVANDVLHRITEACYRRWWTVLLHINNLNGLDEICYRPLWYVSCQFQLCVAIIVPIIVLVKRPNIGSTVMAAALCALIVGTCVQASINEYYPITVLLPGYDFRAVSRTLSSLFYLPFLHGPALIVGVIVGYWALTNKDRNGGKVSRLVCWIMACTGLACALFSSYLWERWFQDAHSAIFLVGPRLAWSCALGWLVHACLTDRTCLLSRMLSSACFVPLGRLFFSAYLISAMVTSSAMLGTRELVYTSHSVLLRQFLANVATSYTAAYVFYVLCGGPADILKAAVWKAYGASEKKESWDQFDKKVRFLSELLGPQPGRLPCKDRPSPMRRIASLKDMVVCHL